MLPSLESDDLQYRVSKGFPRLCTHTSRDKVCIPDRAAPILWEGFAKSQTGDAFSVFNSLRPSLPTAPCYQFLYLWPTPLPGRLPKWYQFQQLPFLVRDSTPGYL